MLLQLKDTEVLINPVVINEVRSRECIWNPRNVHYNNKTDQYQAWVKAWEEVSAAILPKYTTCSEDDKKQIVRAVQSRWKTAHDAYMKCRLREANKPTNKASKHSYIYQKLEFLEQVKDIDKGVNNRVGDDEVSTYSCVVDFSASQSSFTVCDDDVDEARDEVTDFVIDIHEDFNEQIKDVVTTIDGVDEQVRNDNTEQECLPGTSSQNNDQTGPLATEDVTKSPRKRPRSADITKPSRKRPRSADITKSPRKRPRNAGTIKKTKRTAFETKLLKKIMRLKKRAKTSNLQTDDQLFFESLSPLIGKFDIHQKLNLRSKILEAVKEVAVQ